MLSVALACLLLSVTVADEVPPVPDAMPVPEPAPVPDQQLPLNDAHVDEISVPSSSDPKHVSSLRHALQAVLSASKTLPSALLSIAPSALSIKKVVIAVLVASLLAISSSAPTRICPDHRIPVLSRKSFTFCTEYSGSETCLVPLRSGFIDGLYPSEVTVSSEFNKIQFDDKRGSGTCPDLVRRAMCSQADAWASTLFDDGHRLIPHICPAMSSLIWDECADVGMTPNPFDNGSSDTSRRTIRRLFGNRESFEKAFRGDDENDNCFGGVPVDQTKPIPNLPAKPDSKYLGQVCVKRLNFPVEKRFLLGGAPYPTDKNLMAIIDKTGLVSVWTMDGSKIASTKWLDISKNIVSDGSNGLLSIAFHKKFAENGRMFLAMTCKAGSAPSSCLKDGDLVVDEYKVRNPHSRSTPVFSRRILYVDGGFGNSIGGQLLFSPAANEDNLFIVVGDGGTNPKDDLPDPLNNAQSLTSLRGKVLRIGVDGPTEFAAYEVPSDNPFAGQSDARGEIYALGFKNPWRCAHDRLLPEFLFCGDVGQHGYEEMDRIIKGGNYGWKFFEGRHTQDTSKKLGPAPIVFPQFEYPHPKNGGQAAIIGGHVFRPDVPSTIAGTYFFADTFGKLYSAISVPGSGVYRMTPSAGSWRCAKDSPVACDADLGMVFSFFETATGEVFVSTSKAIYKIVDPDHCGLN